MIGEIPLLPILSRGPALAGQGRPRRTRSLQSGFSTAGNAAGPCCQCRSGLYAMV